MTDASERPNAFTLPELMTSVVIAATLAAVQVPALVRFQLRAKAAESRFNLAAIAAAEEAYFVQSGTYVRTGPEPESAPGTMKVLWPGLDEGFRTLGWAPEGSVYYQYEVDTSADHVQFWAVASADIDGNGVPNQWAYVTALPGAPATHAAGPSISAVCVSTGVYDPTTGSQNLLNTVGPCDALSGDLEF